MKGFIFPVLAALLAGMLQATALPVLQEPPKTPAQTLRFHLVNRPNQHAGIFLDSHVIDIRLFFSHTMDEFPLCNTDLHVDRTSIS